MGGGNMVIFSRKKTFLVVFCFLLCFMPALFSQQAKGTQTSIPATDERAILLDTPPVNEGNAIPSVSSSANIWTLIRIVLILLIVCAGIYGTVYILKKSTKTNVANDPYLKNIATLMLSTNKSVRVISIGSQAFLVGVTDQAISLISEIEDKELIDTMNLEADRNTTIPSGNFVTILTSLLPKKIRPVLKTSEEPTVSNRTQDSTSALATSDFLRKQRERIQNSGSPE